MISQFGVKGFNLVNGSFEFYEITVNGEYKGTVSKNTAEPGWKWSTNHIMRYGFTCEHSAIVDIKNHILSVPAREHSVECRK